MSNQHHSSRNVQGSKVAWAEDPPVRADLHQRHQGACPGATGNQPRLRAPEAEAAQPPANAGC